MSVSVAASGHFHGVAGLATAAHAPLAPAGMRGAPRKLALGLGVRGAAALSHHYHAGLPGKQATDEPWPPSESVGLVVVNRSIAVPRSRQTQAVAMSLKGHSSRNSPCDEIG